MENLLPIIFIVAGILVLIMPRLLNYIVALVLILYGLHELNRIHRWAPGLVITQVPPSPHPK
jgi:Protein of unknown function (DUF3096)